MGITGAAMVLVGFSFATTAFVSADQTTLITIMDDFEDGVATEERWIRRNTKRDVPAGLFRDSSVMAHLVL